MFSKPVINFKFILGAILVSVVYLLLNVYMTNHLLLNNTFFGSYPFGYKSAIATSLVWGMPEMMGWFGFGLLVIVGILTGMNLVLFSSRLPALLKVKSGHWTFGFGTLVGTAGGSCPSCGLPLLGWLGLSSSVGVIPLKGWEFSVVAIVLLTISFMVLLKKQVVACNIQTPTRR